MSRRNESRDDASLVTRAVYGLAGRVMRPRLHTFGLRSSGFAGPLQFTPVGLYVWYVLAPLTWDFLTLPERERLWDQQVFRLGRLAESGPVEGRPFRIRVTSTPYPTYEFARSLDEDTPDPLPQVEGAESWADYLAQGQLRLQSTGLDQRMSAVGIWVGPPVSGRVRTELCDTGAGELSPAATKVLQELASIDKIMSGSGFGARQATSQDLACLMHRSLSMGVPIPAHAGAAGARWEATDLVSFCDRRAWIAKPFGSTVQILTEVNGHATERFAAVLTMGVMPDLHWPEIGQPWMVAGAAGLSFPIEWNASGVLQRSKTLEQVVTYERDRAVDVGNHYAEHGQVPPPAVSRAITAATENLDEITEGDARSAGRWTGVIRCAVYGDTEDEALSRARAVEDLYGERLNMPLVRTKDQATVLREFVPGESWAKHGYRRRMPVRYLAAGMPNVDAELGTPAGPYLGYGSGVARRAVRFDLHYAMEVLNRPGLVTLTGEQGAGKSVLMGALAYHAVRRGEPTCIYDPSGPMAALASLPELAPFSRVMDLGRASEGTLAPYGLIPDARREDYATDGTVDEIEWMRALRRTTAERQQLMFDDLRMLLSTGLRRHGGADIELRDAIRIVTGKDHPLAPVRGVEEARVNPRWILDHLAAEARRERGTSRGDLLAKMHRELEAAAESPDIELIIPTHRGPVDPVAVDDTTLVVVTMADIKPPPEGADRDDWSVSELHSQPLLHSAAIFASRFMYARARDVRKNFFADETHFMSSWGSGRSFFVRLSRDSRKINGAVLAASQHPDDHLGIGKLDGLMGAAFVGRLTDHDTASKACRVLGCAPEFAPVIEALSPVGPDGDIGATGEFVVRDPLGRVGKLRVDMDWHPSLRQALQTTPGHRRNTIPPAMQPAPFIDPELFDGIAQIPAQRQDVRRSAA